MMNNELRSYRRTLTRIVREYERHRPEHAQQLDPAPELDEQAAMNHLQYLQGLDEQIRWEVYDAARHALERLNRRSFGRCEDCGRPLGAKRLAAMPWAELCVQCQQQREGEALREAA